MRKSILLALREVLLDRSPLTALPLDTMRKMGALNTWGTNPEQIGTYTLQFH